MAEPVDSAARKRCVRIVRRHSWRVGLFPATHWYGIDLGYWRLVILRG